MSDTNKKCLKCGHARTEADGNAPDYACPKCGAVYAKVEAAMRAKEQARAAVVPSKADLVKAERKRPEYADTDAQANADFARVLEGRVSKGTKIAHVVYGLYLLGFVFPLTWIAGVITAHVMRSPHNEGWLDQHFGWQIRTFWITLLSGTALTVLYVGVTPVFFRGVLLRDGAGLAKAIIGGWVFMGIGSILILWVLYRMIRGWVFLFKGRAP